jgi:hypothetical protein
MNNVVGFKAPEVFPGIRESNPEFLEKQFRVAETGKPDRVELYPGHLRKWFDISACCPEKGYFVASTVYFWLQTVALRLSYRSNLFSGNVHYPA